MTPDELEAIRERAPADRRRYAYQDVPALLADLDAAREALRRVERERDELRQHILDIDAHATPYGDIPGEPGWVGVYLLTAGALHRALGKIGHSAPKCQAEADLKLTQQAFDEYRESWQRATDALLAERNRMRPVVEAARAAAKTNPHSAFPEVVQLRLAERAAVDTYETQENTE